MSAGCTKDTFCVPGSGSPIHIFCIVPTLANRERVSPARRRSQRPRDVCAFEDESLSLFRMSAMLRAPNNSASSVWRKRVTASSIERANAQSADGAEIVIFRACSRVCYGERERERGRRRGWEERYCKLKQWRVESTCSR